MFSDKHFPLHENGLPFANHDQRGEVRLTDSVPMGVCKDLYYKLVIYLASTINFANANYEFSHINHLIALI